MGSKSKMTSDDQRHLLSTFLSDVSDTLAAVIARFGFVLETSEIAPPDMWITFKNTAGVEMTIDFEWGGLLSLVVSKTSWFGPQKRHNLGPLISARSSDTSALYHSTFMAYDRDRILSVLDATARELLTFATDVLAGDFSAFRASGLERE
jgi:hypothetical protein